MSAIQFPVNPIEGVFHYVTPERKYQFINGAWKLHTNNQPLNKLAPVPTFPPIVAEQAPDLQQDNSFWYNELEETLYFKKVVDNVPMWEVVFAGMRASELKPAIDIALDAAAATAVELTDNALVSANSYSDTGDAATLAAATAAATNSGTSALASAISYTDTKALETLSSANAFATNEASAALSSAVSEASSDATSKAAAALSSANAYTDTAVEGIDITETSVAIAAGTINASLGELFTKTISTATTFNVTDPNPSGEVTSFVLELTNGGSAAITWWSNIRWSGGQLPTLTAAGVDVLGFYSRDGGLTWRGFVMSIDSKGVA